MDEFFASNRLSAYIDGELSDTEMAEVARAIEEQPDLRASYEELLAAVELLREHGPVQAPAHFHSNVMRRVEALPSPGGWLARLLGPLGQRPWQAAGVVVLAAAVLLLVFRGPILQPELAPADEPAVEHEAAAPQVRADEASADQTEAAVEQAAPELGSAEAAGEEPQAASAPRQQVAPTTSKRGTGSARSSGKGSTLQELLEKEEGTYVPEWDKDPAGELVEPQAAEPARDEPEGSADFAASPFAYRLTPTEPNALRRLVALAEKLGGSVTDAGGQPFQPYSLTVERNYAKVYMQIPASRLESVEPYLRQVGGVVTVHTDEDRLYSADAVQVSVEVTYQP